MDDQGRLYVVGEQAGSTGRSGLWVYGNAEQVPRGAVGMALCRAGARTRQLGVAARRRAVRWGDTSHH